MRPTTRSAAAALALALAACGAKDQRDPYLDAIPDAAGLTIDAQASGAAGALVAIDPSSLTTAGDDLAVVHDKAEALNGAVRHVFARLEEITATRGHELPNGVKVWGPAIRCVERDSGGACLAGGEASLRLTVKRYTDRAASFALEATDPAAVGAFKPVLAGYLLRGPVARRGAGRLWVNLENLKVAAPGFRGQGYLGAGFASGPVAKVATYRMVTFTRDPALHPAVTAAFGMWKNEAGVSRARVAGFGDLDRSGPALELGLWHGVWHPAYGGRAFTVVTSFDDNGPLAGGNLVGDVPAGKYWFGRACYAPGRTTPEYKEWFLCDRTALVNGVPTAVSPRACVVQNGGVGAPVIGSGTWADSSCHWTLGGAEPEGLLPPGLGPTDHPDDDRPEDGDANVGLMPEECPTTVSSTMPDTRPPGMGM